MSANAEQAVAKALATTAWAAGLCLQFVRSMYGVAADGNDSNADGVTDGIGAAQQWNSIRDEHRFITSNPADVPRGAPCWMHSPTGLGKKYGHVAIALGGGQMRTTAANSTVKTVNMAVWISQGYTLKGWSDWINDTLIDGIMSTQIRRALGSRDLQVRTMGTDVREAQDLLNTWPSALPDLVPDGDFYTKSAERTAEFQSWVGLEPTGVLDAVTLAALRAAPVPDPVDEDPEQPAPPVVEEPTEPTEPGYYVDAGGALWHLREDLEGDFWWSWKSLPGRPDRSGNGPMSELAPLTLAPQELVDEWEALIATPEPDPEPPATPVEPEEAPMPDPVPVSARAMLRALLAALAVALRAQWPPLRAALADAVKGALASSKEALWTAFGGAVEKFKATSLQNRRTILPILSGGIVGWLVAKGLPLPAESEAWLTHALEFVCAAVWYRSGAMLERSDNTALKRAGKILVGGGTPPTYVTPAVSDPSALVGSPH